MVFVTSGAFTPDAKAFLDQVANERFEKPFEPKVLRALIQEFSEREFKARLAVEVVVDAEATSSGF